MSIISNQVGTFVVGIVGELFFSIFNCLELKFSFFLKKVALSFWSHHRNLTWSSLSFPLLPKSCWYSHCQATGEWTVLRWGSRTQPKWGSKGHENWTMPEKPYLLRIPLANSVCRPEALNGHNVSRIAVVSKLRLQAKNRCWQHQTSQGSDTVLRTIPLPPGPPLPRWFYTSVLFSAFIANPWPAYKPVRVRTLKKSSRDVVKLVLQRIFFLIWEGWDVCSTDCLRFFLEASLFMAVSVVRYLHPWRVRRDIFPSRSYFSQLCCDCGKAVVHEFAFQQVKLTFRVLMAKIYSSRWRKARRTDPTVDFLHKFTWYVFLKIFMSETQLVLWVIFWKKICMRCLAQNSAQKHQINKKPLYKEAKISRTLYWRQETPERNNIKLFLFISIIFNQLNKYVFAKKTSGAYDGSQEAGLLLFIREGVEYRQTFFLTFVKTSRKTNGTCLG